MIDASLGQIKPREGEGARVEHQCPTTHGRHAPRKRGIQYSRDAGAGTEKPRRTGYPHARGMTTFCFAGEGGKPGDDQRRVAVRERNPKIGRIRMLSRQLRHAFVRLHAGLGRVRRNILDSKKMFGDPHTLDQPGSLDAVSHFCSRKRRFFVSLFRNKRRRRPFLETHRIRPLPPGAAFACRPSARRCSRIRARWWV